MSAAAVHKVRLEPVGIEMDVEEGETVLDAAFRQGIALMHGCKEGQCSACKSKLVDGDIELLKYSTFALPEYESETGHILLCRTHAYSDVTIELLNFDEELLSRSIPVKSFSGTVTGVTALTHDIRLLEIELESPLRFWAGQYVDLTIPGRGVTRAYSMANTPSEQRRLQFIVKKYTIAFREKNGREFLLLKKCLKTMEKQETAKIIEGFHKIGYPTSMLNSLFCC